MFKFEDKALKTTFNVSGAAGSLDIDPQSLPSLIMEEKWNKEDFPAFPYCADKAPLLGSSQGTCRGCQLEKRDSSHSKKWDENVQDCIRTNSLQWETDRHCHVKRRIMIYLCGGYKGKNDNHRR